MDTTKAITHLSICSGYDGIGIGLKKILPTLRTICYVEREAYAICNLLQKMESEQLDAAPIYSDVKTFPYKKFFGKVSILSAGFPCQSFSSSGLRKGVNDDRHIYPFISKGIEQCNPTSVFFENVKGIISSRTAEGQSVLQYVLSDLERLGYQATAGIFSSSEVGYPHQRQRVFVFGIKKLSNTSGKRRTKICVERKQSSNDLFECVGEKRNVVARQNEDQFNWEEPRTKSKLGRTTYGVDCRLDRLRLLGNGCQPQVVMKAFVTLYNRFLVRCEDIT